MPFVIQKQNFKVLSHDFPKAFILLIIISLSGFKKMIKILQICILKSKFSNKFLNILFTLTLRHFCNPRLLLPLTTPPLPHLTLPNTTPTAPIFPPNLNLPLQLPNPIIKLFDKILCKTRSLNKIILNISM